MTTRNGWAYNLSMPVATSLYRTCARLAGGSEALDAKLRELHGEGLSAGVIRSRLYEWRGIEASEPTIKAWISGAAADPEAGAA